MSVGYIPSTPGVGLQSYAYQQPTPVASVRPVIYLAGRISRGDWRESLFWGVVGEEPDRLSGYWPVSAGRGAFDYCGPYFTNQGHGMDHGPGQHGVAENRINEYGYDRSDLRRRTFRACLNAIRACTVFFAWLEDGEAYGTLVEIGYARAMNKKVVVAHPPDVDLSDQWFALQAADRVIVADGPVKAVESLADDERQFDSPIEAMFWRQYVDMRPAFPEELVPQFEVFGGRYRLDFALPGRKVAIELDGYEFHSTREQFTNDRKRQRELELDGWRVVRFSGSEVNADAAGCVRQAAQFATLLDASITKA